MSEPYDDEVPTEAVPLPEPLPTLVRVSTAFSQRMPTQRVLDQLSRIEGSDFGALATAQPFRIVAFRALLRDFPDYDVTALWMHAYDTEVEMEDVNPTNGTSPTSGPPSVGTGDYVPQTLTP
jgi:hypothetical protein